MGMNQRPAVVAAAVAAGTTKLAILSSFCWFLLLKAQPFYFEKKKSAQWKPLYKLS